MIRKMMLLAVSVGALVALAAPAVAQATELKEGNKKLAVGSEVTATSTNLKTTTSQGTLACELVTLHATVAQNGPGNVIIEPVVTTTAECHILTPATHAATITEPTVGTITIGGGVGSASATFIADIPDFELECHFSGAVGFTYVAGTGVLSVPGSPLAGSGTNCPAAGTIEGSFTLETANGSPVTIVN
jgi:hypothetical protein